MKKYGDIIDLPHYVSPDRIPMSMVDRGAQFSPFAALTGFEGQIEETARLTQTKPELSEEERGRIGETLSLLLSKGLPRTVLLTHFIKDELKPGGKIVTREDTVKKIDPRASLLVLRNGETIRFSDLLELEDAEDETENEQPGF